MSQILRVLACAALSFGFVAGHPGSARFATVLGNTNETKDAYDYVIVGGGTAGLTVGDRLSESDSILVIENGNLYPEGFGPGKTRYNITSKPCPGLANRTFEVGAGRVVGGSSAINGMVFERGTAADYDLWGELGGPNSTWNWENMLKYFKKGIHFTPPKPNVAKAFNITYDSNNWGRDPNTRIYATYPAGLEPSLIPMYQAMRDFPGVDVPVDGAGGKTGLFWFTTSMDPETYNRSYAKSGHWDGLNRTNYQLVTGTKVNKILFDDDNVASGVSVVPSDGGKAKIIKAKKEVILAAGSIHTPQVLQLSGIGPADLLKKANITVKVDLPGVGSNFQDHYYIPFLRFEWGGAQPSTPKINITSTRADRHPAVGAFLSLPAYAPDKYKEIADKYAAQDPAVFLPNGTHKTIIEGYKQQKRAYAEAMRGKDMTFLEYMLSGRPTCQPQHVHPVSRGTVGLDAADPEGEVVVDYRAGTNPVDIEVVMEQVRFFRRFMGTGALGRLNATEAVPGAAVATDEQLAAWVRRTVVPSVYHPVGTAAKMRREWGGVVDEELRVYGVRGVSVVDASIMPTIVGGTTSMTVYAIAEKVGLPLLHSRAVTSS